MECEDCKVEMRGIGTVVVDRNIQANSLLFSGLFQCPICKRIEMGMDF